MTPMLIYSVKISFVFLSVESALVHQAKLGLVCIETCGAMGCHVKQVSCISLA